MGTWVKEKNIVGEEAPIHARKHIGYSIPG